MNSHRPEPVAETEEDEELETPQAEDALDEVLEAVAVADEDMAAETDEQAPEAAVGEHEAALDQDETADTDDEEEDEDK